MGERSSNQWSSNQWSSNQWSITSTLDVLTDGSATAASKLQSLPCFERTVGFANGLKDHPLHGIAGRAPLASFGRCTVRVVCAHDVVVLFKA